MLDFLSYALVAAVLAYLGLVILALRATPGLLFAGTLRSGTSVSDPLAYPTLSLAGGIRIAYCYHENAAARRLLFYHHGNAEQLDDLKERITAFHQRGFSVLAYDYPGYGTSTGVPTPRHCLEAAEAVLQYACKDLGWSKDNIVSYGRSLGGAPCLALAARHRFAAAVVESTFASVFRVVTRVPLLPWDIFNNLKTIRHVRCPVLLYHGTDDTTVPFYHGSMLLKAAPAGSEQMWVEGANHINLMETAGEAYWEKLLSFAHRQPTPNIHSI